MPKEKEKIEPCKIAEDKVVKAVAECLEKNCEEVAVYVDYNVIRHPALTAYVILINVGSNTPAELENLLGSTLVEITLPIDAVSEPQQTLSNVLDRISEVRVRCLNGWISYGYTTMYTQYRVPYATKSWLFTPENRIENMPLQLNDSEQAVLMKLLDLVLKKVREIVYTEIL
ncbi:MAG: hypothetical protein JHC33_11810 [Ignisphaera sp.]|nr:hypothetical protein [Ignisphaera sp.]